MREFAAGTQFSRRRTSELTPSSPSAPLCWIARQCRMTCRARWTLGKSATGSVEQVLHRYFASELGRVRQLHCTCAQRRSRQTGGLPWERQLLSRSLCILAILAPNKGSIPYDTHLPKVTHGTETSLRRKTAVIVGNRERSDVCRRRHFARPSERTERIVGTWPNGLCRARRRISNVERDDGCRITGVSQVDYRSIRERVYVREYLLVDDRYILQTDRQPVFRDLHGVVGNLQDPEKSGRADPSIEVMYLCRWRPETREREEINSYLDKGAVCPDAGSSASVES